MDALDDREFSGSLVSLLQNAMEFVLNNSRKKWMKTGDGRIDLPDYGEHYSPGGMYDGSFIQERDITNVPSKRRNPIIADIFNRLRYMERRGSGFKKICAEYENQILYTKEKAPEFYSDHDSFVLTLKNLNYKKASIKKRR